MSQEDAHREVSGLSTGFPPIARADARVLVLGSLPSEASLRAQQYYAHPRNAFWNIMQVIAGAAGGYASRCRALEQRGIAVWDVLQRSVRPGSLDADIDMASAVPNDFAGFFAGHLQVRLVCFNGRKAQAVFRRELNSNNFRSVELGASGLLRIKGPDADANHKLYSKVYPVGWRVVLPLFDTAAVR